MIKVTFATNINIIVFQLLERYHVEKEDRLDYKIQLESNQKKAIEKKRI